MTVEALVNVGLPLEVLERAVERHPDRMVVRRVERLDRRESSAFRTGVFNGVVIDTETTGLDHGRDRLFEIAVQTFVADEAGQIVATGPSRSWLEDPGMPIPAEATEVTGLRTGDLRGRAISEGEASGLIGSADLIIAHNAAFDRPFLDRRLPYIQGRPWACTAADLDWRALGFEGRALHHILLQAGWFYKAHRAEVDVWALMRLLDHRLDDGTSVFSKLLDRARRPDWVVEVRDPPRDANAILRGRGYRWNEARGTRQRRVSDAEVDLELEWATIHVYRARRSPEKLRQDWTTRYAAL